MRPVVFVHDFEEKSAIFFVFDFIAYLCTPCEGHISTSFIGCRSASGPADIVQPAGGIVGKKKPPSW